MLDTNIVYVAPAGAMAQSVPWTNAAWQFVLVPFDPTDTNGWQIMIPKVTKPAGESDQ
jgi:hypothetical protein